MADIVNNELCVPQQCPYKLNLYEIIGWIGALLLVIAYYLIQTGRVGQFNKVYIYLNVIGSILIVINAWANRAYPSTVLNVVWAAIGILTLFGVFGN